MPKKRSCTITSTDEAPMTADEHLIATDKLIGDTARATYAGIREAHGKKAAKARRGHFDAAVSFVRAGEALYTVAQMLAEGHTREDRDVQLYLRVAEAKEMEGLRRMAGVAMR